MPLNPTERELVAIGASVGAGCHPCLEYHLQAGAEAGLPDAALLQALADAECVKRSSYNQLATHGRELLRVAVEAPADCCTDSNVAKEFVSIGAAIGANSLANLQKHVEAARTVGLSALQITMAIRVAQTVQRTAAERLAEASAHLAATEPASAAAAPIWLSPTEPAAASCGPECGCHEQAAAPATQAVAEAACACGGACAGEEEREAQPVGVAAGPGKCC
jgi:AhpD family alkylhydroperoxidase